MSGGIGIFLIRINLFVFFVETCVFLEIVSQIFLSLAFRKMVSLHTKFQVDSSETFLSYCAHTGVLAQCHSVILIDWVEFNVP